MLRFRSLEELALDRKHPEWAKDAQAAIAHFVKAGQVRYPSPHDKVRFTIGVSLVHASTIERVYNNTLKQPPEDRFGYIARMYEGFVTHALAKRAENDARREAEGKPLPKRKKRKS
ncbi:MAG: hypothetical protein P1V51_24590 [Deltaproteobacteria bacterium]|nr:hypothetical protein [Deltaproteobacteria bacterium]